MMEMKLSESYSGRYTQSRILLWGAVNKILSDEFGVGNVRARLRGEGEEFGIFRYPGKKKSFIKKLMSLGFDVYTDRDEIVILLPNEFRDLLLHIGKYIKNGYGALIKAIDEISNKIESEFIRRILEFWLEKIIEVEWG